MWDPWADTRASEDLKGRLEWFLLGRVVVVSCFLAAVGVLYLRGDASGYALPVKSILTVIVATYSFSVVSALLLDRLRNLAAFAYTQIAFDVLLISGVIFLTGGVESPFPFLYGLPIVNGAGLLLTPGALVSATLAAAAYNGINAALVLGFLEPPYPFLAPTLDLQLGLRFASTQLGFFAVAYLAGVLTSRVRSMEILLSERQAERDRLTLLQDTLARTIDSGLITTDPDGRVTSANQSAENLAGQPMADLIGRDIGTIFPPLQLTASARLRFLQSTGLVDPTEFTHLVNGGPGTQIRCAATPLSDTYGHPIGALYVLQDVTKLREIEREELPPDNVQSIYQMDLEAGSDIADGADGLYGTSSAIAQVRQMIDRVSASDTTILITGESGTGKELVARAIHTHSPRRDKPFVAINCGAIPENLIESELFGHVRGAFTGAVSDRTGCFRLADGGTIFLDEIAELPLNLQVKMLRVVQERVFRPVGGETNVAVNVRIIAATNKNLAERVRTGQFREDLFYRLNVIDIELPPLRERRDDILLLIRHFLQRYSEAHGRQVARLSPGAGRLLLSYPYPGNIRELENIVEHAVALSDGDTATEEHLPPYVLGSEHPRIVRPVDRAVVHPVPELSSAPNRPLVDVDLEHDLAQYEKSILLRALDEAGGIKKRAAELLGINYRSFRHRLQKYDLGEGTSTTPADED